METKTEVMTFEVDYQCPKCKNGRLRPTGQTLLTYPAKFPHACNSCEYIETFTGKSYPYLDYKLK